MLEQSTKKAEESGELTDHRNIFTCLVVHNLAQKNNAR